MLETEVKKLNKNLELLNTGIASLLEKLGGAPAPMPGISNQEEAEALAQATVAQPPVTETVIPQQAPVQTAPVQTPPLQPASVKQTVGQTTELPITTPMGTAQPVQSQLPIDTTTPVQAPPLQPAAQAQPILPASTPPNAELSQLMVTAAQITGDALYTQRLLNQAGVKGVDQLDEAGQAWLTQSLQQAISTAQAGA